MTTLFLIKKKLDYSFPCAQFEISDYEISARIDRNKYGGDLLEFVKKWLICKRLTIFETANSECICSELTIPNKKWVCFSVCCPPFQETLGLFFDKLSFCLSKASETYKNFIAAKDFNIDKRTNVREYEKFEDF